MPKPIPVTANQPETMTLELYRSLRASVIVIAEAATEAASGEETEDAIPTPPKNLKPVMEKLTNDVRENEDEILRALASPLAIQRELAARVLALAGDHAAVVKALTLTLSKDSDDDVRAAAAFTLGRLADADAVEVLIMALGDSAENVRLHCASALGSIKDERAVSGLLRVLQSDLRPGVRLQAALSLGKIKHPTSLETLSFALDSESDERVKLAIAAAIRAVSGNDATALPQEIPEQADYQKDLADLSDNMHEVAGKLREDRHDTTVQIDQENIDSRLTDLIRELEKVRKAQQSSQQQNSPRQKEQEQRQAMLGAQPQTSQPPRRAAEKLQSNPTAGNNGDSASVVGKADRWARLPEKDRDELLQVFRPEVPLRWRKRLEAYFISVAAEEVKDQEKAKPK
ncbi:MAG TPA: HEAT repeat domain-containing protein [Planctomycetota bacterium]